MPESKSPQKKVLTQQRKREIGRRYLGKLVVGAITLIAIELRLLCLGRKSLWFDEVISFSIASLDPAGFRNILFSWEANMGLYYLILRQWLHLGVSEFVVRLPSAIFGVLTVPLLFSLGRRLFGEKTGLIASLLLAVNAFHVRYSQEARSYILFCLLAVAAAWFYSRVIERPSRSNWVGFIVSLTLALYSHFFAVLLLPVFWLTPLLARKRDFDWKGLCTSSCGVFLLALPIELFALLKNKGQTDWVQPTSWHAVYNFLLLLSGRNGAVLLILTLICIAVGLSYQLSAQPTPQSENQQQRTWARIFVRCWFLLPLLLTLLLSLHKPMFVSRYLILCLPAFVLLVADGIAQIRPMLLSASLLIAVSLLSLQGTFAYYRSGFDPPDQDWRGVVNSILQQAQAGDAIFFYHPQARLPYEYYAQRSPRVPHPTVVFPERGDARLVKGIKIDPSFLEGLPYKYRRVWVVENYGPDWFTEKITDTMVKNYHLAERRDFGIMHVFLYEK